MDWVTNRSRRLQDQLRQRETLWFPTSASNASPPAFFLSKTKNPRLIYIFTHIYIQPRSAPSCALASLYRMQAEPAGGAEVAAKTHPPLPFFPLHFQADDDVCFAALCRIVSRPRPCGDDALWEIWAVGASHAGGSSSSGHSAAAVPAGDDGRGISVVCLFQPGSGGNQRDHHELSLGLLESPSSQHGTL